MFTSNFFTTVRHALLALLMAGSASLAGAATYHVDIDTSGYSGGGYLDMLFGSLDPAAPAASATLSNFSGSLGALIVQDGDVSGNLSSGAVFGTAGAFNELFYSVALGGKFSFDIAFGGPLLSSTGNAGSTFGVAMYDANGYLGYQGNVVEFQLLPNSAAGPGGVTAAAYGIGSVTAVPEPSTWLMLAAGALVLVVVARRRQPAAAAAPALATA